MERNLSMNSRLRAIDHVRGMLWGSTALVWVLITGVGVMAAEAGCETAVTASALVPASSFDLAHRVAVRPDVLSAPYRGTSPVPSIPVDRDVLPQAPHYDRLPVSPAPATQEPSIDDKLTQRYSDSRMVRFLQSHSLAQITSMYLEASQLIDQRHVNPISYQERTARALSSLGRALEHPLFLRAVGQSPNPTAVRQVQAELSGLLQRQSITSARDAAGVMQYAATLVSRTAGVRAEAAAFEFLHGSLDSLDQFSAFVPAETTGGPSAGLEENIVGIGVELKAHDEGALIVGVVEGGPAAAARLQRGDVVIGINGRSMQGLTLNEVADQIGGPAGSSVELRIRRGDRDGQVRLTRRSVYVSSVTGVQLIDPQQKVGYIRLKQFSESAASDLDKALWQLHREGMQTLILDLRGNPGGLLTSAIEISDKFLPCGSIVSTRGRTSQDNSLETATYDRTWKVPLVVLIDEHSASASEILAAAIQENERGVIIGRRSYGKGTVQTHFPLRTVSGDLKLTTANFFSPRGRKMAGEGVLPDVPVAASRAGLEFAPQEDGDILAALESSRQGRPAQLASQSGSCRLHTQGAAKFPL